MLADELIRDMVGADTVVVVPDADDTLLTGTSTLRPPICTMKNCRPPAITGVAGRAEGGGAVPPDTLTLTAGTEDAGMVTI